MTTPGHPFTGDERFADRLGAPVTPADVTTAGLLRAAAEQPVRGPLRPLYLRRPDAVPPGAGKPVSR